METLTVMEKWLSKNSGRKVEILMLFGRIVLRLHEYNDEITQSLDKNTIKEAFNECMVNWDSHYRQFLQAKLAYLNQRRKEYLVVIKDVKRAIKALPKNP